jgi:hypothetical protein
MNQRDTAPIRAAIVDDLSFASRTLRRLEQGRRTIVSIQQGRYAMRKLHEAWGLTQALVILDKPADSPAILLAIVQLQISLRRWT